MLALFLSTSAVPRPPLAKERALHASSPEINWPWELSTPDLGDISSCIFDAPTPEYDPFMHVKGTPSILFGVMTGTETVEARAKSVLLTWCADLDACIFFSDEHNENKQPATCAPAPSPLPPYAPAPSSTPPDSMACRPHARVCSPPGADKLDMSTWTKAQKQQYRTASVSHPDLAIAGARRAQLRYMPALWVLQQLILQREPYADSRFAKVEWVSLVDDDAYVMYANLQAVLQGHDTSKAVYTGHVSPDTWLPDHVDGCDIELGVSTNTSFVAGGPGAYFTKRVLETVDLELCLRESLPGAEYDGWQSDWIVARCLKTHADVLPTTSGHGNFVQFACNEDGVVLPCEISASSEDPQSFDENPASLHPVKSSDQMIRIHNGLMETFGSSAKHTISRADVREHLWSAANEEWRDAARLRRELKEQRALRDDGKGHHTSLQKVSTLYATDPTSWDAFGTSLIFEDDLLMTSASSETVGKVSPNPNPC